MGQQPVPSWIECLLASTRVVFSYRVPGTGSYLTALSCCLADARNATVAYLNIKLQS